MIGFTDCLRPLIAQFRGVLVGRHRAGYFAVQRARHLHWHEAMYLFRDARVQMGGLQRHSVHIGQD